jgi:hypothetical protein
VCCIVRVRVRVCVRVMLLVLSLVLRPMHHTAPAELCPRVTQHHKPPPAPVPRSHVHTHVQALHVAAMRDNTAAIEALLDAGLPAAVRSSRGWKAFDEACAAGAMKAARCVRALRGLPACVCALRKEPCLCVYVYRATPAQIHPHAHTHASHPTHIHTRTQAAAAAHARRGQGAHEGAAVAAAGEPA